MKDLEELKEIMLGQKGFLAEKFKVKEIGVFGSFVRGDQGAASDTDILVEFSEPVSLFPFIDLEDYLSEILGMKVDLVSKKALKHHIGRNILRVVVTI